MHMVFRDHTISDLIGFVYSGMPPADAARHLINNIKEAAKPVLDKGRDAVVSIILDGENAWEYYPKSGREFLRRFYDALQREPGIEARHNLRSDCAPQRVSASSIRLCPDRGSMPTSTSGSARPRTTARGTTFITRASSMLRMRASAPKRSGKLAFDEILIAEGSDWNWWYGPEHHSANDRDFDELYRKHLSNVYQALGAVPPDYLAQPITGAEVRPSFIPQTAYIHPRVAGDKVRYFEWMGAAAYTADHRAGAMHGKQFLLDAVYAGIDTTCLYGRLDFAGKVPRRTSRSW